MYYLLFFFFQDYVEDFNCNFAWKYAGIEPPVFAALVPNSADKPLKEVMEEIMGDHEMMVYSYTWLGSNGSYPLAM